MRSQSSVFKNGNGLKKRWNGTFWKSQIICISVSCVTMGERRRQLIKYSLWTLSTVNDLSLFYQPLRNDQRHASVCFPMSVCVYVCKTDCKPSPLEWFSHSSVRAWFWNNFEAQFDGQGCRVTIGVVRSSYSEVLLGRQPKRFLVSSFLTMLSLSLLFWPIRLNATER